MWKLQASAQWFRSESGFVLTPLDMRRKSGQVNHAVTAKKKTTRKIPVTIHLNDQATFWQMLVVATLAFVLTNPYAVLDPIPFFTEIATQAGMVSGRLDWPFTRQYFGTLPLWYTIEQQARWTLGLPLTLAVAVTTITLVPILWPI